MIGFQDLWSSLLPVGLDPRTGGYNRHLGTASYRAVRQWFADRASEIGLDHEVDRNGNQWARWGPAGPNTLVLGSHLDSVPTGGAFDGPLGVAAALAAVEALKVRGFQPDRPVAVVAFLEEEGGGFGRPCLGSNLLTGGIAPSSLTGLRDRTGNDMEHALADLDIDPEGTGADPDLLAQIGLFVEVHIEQGRIQDRLQAPLAIGSRILAHGRWRFDFHGRADHAGTTEIGNRRDPMIAYARTVLAAQELMVANPRARATFGRVAVQPNATNAIAADVNGWLDARAESGAEARRLVQELHGAALGYGAANDVSVSVTEESWSGAVEFDHAWVDELGSILGKVPVVDTGAGHDAGVLSTHCPTAMIFVRNPSGISHSPQENATADDCARAAEALAGTVEVLCSRRPAAQGLS